MQEEEQEEEGEGRENPFNSNRKSHTDAGGIFKTNVFSGLAILDTEMDYFSSFFYLCCNKKSSVY